MSGLTPLHVAAHGGDPAVVRALLQAGATTECRTQGGYTPLHLAALMGHQNALLMLLSGGSQPAAESGAGTIPFLLADSEEVAGSSIPPTPCLSPPSYRSDAHLFNPCCMQCYCIGERDPTRRGSRGPKREEIDQAARSDAAVLSGGECV